MASSSWQERIPFDVLREIFEHCARLDQDQRYRSQTQIALQNVAAVCRYWRLVVLSNPVLWSTISMLDATPFELHRVETFLEKAQNVPLSIVMLFQPNRNASKETNDRASIVSQALDLFAHHQEQWNTFELINASMVTSDNGQENNFNINLTNVPLLQSLRFRASNVTLDIPCAKSLLHLTTIELSHLNMPYNFPSLEDCVFLLNAAPNLISAVLVPFYSKTPSIPSLPDVLCHHLKWLSVGSLGGFKMAGTLLSCMTAPALETMRIYHDDWIFDDGNMVENAETDNSIHEFLERSKPPLECFAIGSVSWQDPHLISLLKLMPEVKELNITFCRDLSVHFLNALRFDPDYGMHNLCPDLSEIVFSTCSFSRDVLDAIHEYDQRVIDAAASMITSRWDHKKLAKIELRGRRMDSLVENKRTLRCTKEGLALSVSSSLQLNEKLWEVFLGE